MGVPVDLDSLTPAFLRLVEETVAQVEACPLRPDVTFDGYESLIAAIRSATTLEGTLLEKGIALVAAANPDLVLIGLERPLPVHEAARAVFRRNDWSRAAGLRLDSEVATREHYMPDLLIVDGTRNLALIVDVKRSAASYKPRTLAELRSRMMASALVVRDVLEREHDAPPIAGRQRKAHSSRIGSPSGRDSAGDQARAEAGSAIGTVWIRRRGPVRRGPPRAPPSAPIRSGHARPVPSMPRGQPHEAGGSPLRRLHRTEKRM